MSIFKAIYELQAMCRKADVVGTPRLSISFDDERDKQYFEAELKREIEAKTPGVVTHYIPINDMTLYGIRVRII